MPHFLFCTAFFRLPKRQISAMASFRNLTDYVDVQNIVSTAQSFADAGNGYQAHTKDYLRKRDLLGTAIAANRGHSIQVITSESVDSNVSDHALFNLPPSELAEVILTYVPACLKLMEVPKLRGSVPAAGTVQDRIRHLRSWLKSLRSAESGPFDWKYYVSTRLQQLYHKLVVEGQLRPSSSDRHYLTRDDILYLIDEDMEGVVKEGRQPHSTPTSLHHLAWCFGVTCGIRPGSLISSRQNAKEEFKDLLAWKDIQIPCANGAFLARVTFKRLKGKADDPLWEARRPHVLCIRSASTMERFTLSIPECLLVELLDRDFLEHYPRNDPSSLRRALFEGTKHSIAMKDEALEQFASYDPSPSSATARNGADSALLKQLVQRLSFEIPMGSMISRKRSR